LKRETNDQYKQRMAQDLRGTHAPSRPPAGASPGGTFLEKVRENGQPFYATRIIRGGGVASPSQTGISCAPRKESAWLRLHDL
jgi:hypothetical protein